VLSDRFADPRPWMPASVVAFLAARVGRQDRVLEFGGGASSAWWCQRAGLVHTVEADHDWAAVMLTEIGKRPEWLKHWTLSFVPCNWNPNLARPKRYWTQHRDRIDKAEAAVLEAFYARITFDPTIIVIDGSIRTTCVRVTEAYTRETPVRMVVVDNMETMARHVEGCFAGYRRHDFHETDPALIPPHQNGAWTTSVFVKDASAHVD
jgi:hypothetical protein